MKKLCMYILVAITLLSISFAEEYTELYTLWSIPFNLKADRCKARLEERGLIVEAKEYREIIHNLSVSIPEEGITFLGQPIKDFKFYFVDRNTNSPADSITLIQIDFLLPSEIADPPMGLTEDLKSRIEACSSLYGVLTEHYGQPTKTEINLSSERVPYEGEIDWENIEQEMVRERISVIYVHWRNVELRLSRAYSTLALSLTFYNEFGGSAPLPTPTPLALGL